MSFNKVMFPSASDHWSTPKDVYDALDKEFHFTYDPCPLNCKENNLGKRWGGIVFVNPPYSDIKTWARECHIQWQLGSTVDAYPKSHRYKMVARLHYESN